MGRVIGGDVVMLTTLQRRTGWYPDRLIRAGALEGEAGVGGSCGDEGELMAVNCAEHYHGEHYKCLG